MGEFMGDDGEFVGRLQSGADADPPAARDAVGSRRQVVVVELDTSCCNQFFECAYGGMTNSIATTWDIRSNKIGFSTDGMVSGGVEVEGITLGGNNDIDFTLTYDGTFLTQQLVDTVTGVEFTLNLLIGDITSILGDDLAYVGFGAASRQSDQVISNFSYITVPMPGSMGVIAAGLFAATRRRRS